MNIEKYASVLMVAKVLNMEKVKLNFLIRVIKSPLFLKFMQIANVH